MSIDDMIVNAARCLLVIEQKVWPWMIAPDVELSERQVRRHMTRMAETGLFERIGQRGGYRLVNKLT